MWIQRHLRGEKLRCKFLAWKSAKLLANLSVLARKSANFFANFSATKVTSLPSISLSLSLSLSRSLSVSLSLTLSLSLSHRAHLTHNIGSASALPIISSFDKWGLICVTNLQCAGIDYTALAKKNWDSRACQTTGEYMLERARACTKCVQDSISAQEEIKYLGVPWRLTCVTDGLVALTTAECITEAPLTGWIRKCKRK